MRPCNLHIINTLQLTEDMLRLADRGETDREDNGCGILFGVLRDSAYKLRQLAESEKQNHIRKGWWPKEKEQDLASSPHKGESSSMAKLKGTQSERNLLTAFAGESQARNRYTYFAGQARKEGFVQIADIFIETAEQEKEHAKRFFKFLEGGEVEIGCAFPAGVIGATLDNLKAAAAGERHEHTSMYPDYAKIAEQEGFLDIAAAFRAISVAEKQHEKRYLDLAANIEAKRVFKRDRQVTWRCRNCGYLHVGTSAPELCPACVHPQAHFELLGENW